MPLKSKHNISMFLKKKGTMLGENAPEPLQLCHTFLFVIFSFPFLLFILGFALLPMQLPLNSCIALSYIFQAFGSLSIFFLFFFLQRKPKQCCPVSGSHVSLGSG